MADYKRFVSYMYEYENGVKRKNVGYARVEIRNGECKFTIYMQIDGLKEGIFPTYLIYNPSDEMELVYLGDSAVKNQIMDSRLTAKENNVMDSGYRFSEMGGLLLFLNSEVFYATKWDDKPVVLREVLEALKPKPKDKFISVKHKQDQEENPVYIKGRSQDGKPEYTESKASDEKIEDKLSIGKESIRDDKPEDKEAATGYNEISQTSEFTDYKTNEKTAYIEENTDEKPAIMKEGFKEDKTVFTKESEPDERPAATKESGPDERLAATKESRPDENISDKNAVYIKENQLDEQPMNIKKDLPDGMDVYVKESSSDEKHGDLRDGNQNETPAYVEGSQDVKAAVRDEESIHTIERGEEDKLTEPAKKSSVQFYKLPRGWKTKEWIGKDNQKEAVNPWDLVDKYRRHEAGTQKIPDIPANDMIKTKETQKENPLINKIFSHYPRIYPFEDNDIKRCVKIEPKDIGILPADTWSLSSNSFLLHGYYCYHHLIFAEMTDRYGVHYILGVPGIYHNRERFMARMFGFECFKSIRRREPRLGDFGYWYAEVKL